jgi:hypothetical protein
VKAVRGTSDRFFHFFVDAWNCELTMFGARILRLAALDRFLGGNSCADYLFGWSCL